MSRRKQGFAGAAILAGSVLWGTYSAFSTARNIPDDASGLIKFIVDPPANAPWLLAFVTLVFLVQLFWKRGGNDENLSYHATSHGPHSPAFGNVQGDVHITHAPLPATVQERKKPASVQAEEEIARRLRIGFSGRPPGLATFERDEPKPDLNLTELLVRIYAILGPMPDENLARAKLWRRVDLEIADKVTHNRLHVWGRTGRRPLTLIERDQWDESVFDHKLKTLHVPVAYNNGYDLADLHFNRVEVDRIWPQPVTTTNDGKP